MVLYLKSVQEAEEGHTTAPAFPHSKFTSLEIYTQFFAQRLGVRNCHEMICTPSPLAPLLAKTNPSSELLLKRKAKRH